MTWKPRPLDDAPIDPFNAPDPVMPTEADPPQNGDASGMREDGPGDRESKPRHRRDRHPWHRGARHEDAPVLDGEAPCSGTPARPAPPRETRASAPAGGGIRRQGKADRSRRSLKHVVYLVLFLILFGGAIGSALSACGAALEGALGTLFEELGEGGTDRNPRMADVADAYDGQDASTGQQVEAAAEDDALSQTTERLDAMAGGDEDALSTAANAFADAFETYAGLSTDEAGIDARSVAARVLSSLSYDAPVAYASVEQGPDGFNVNCTVYYDLTIPNINDIAYALRWETPEAIWESYRATGSLDSAGRAALDDQIDGILTSAVSDAPTYSTYLEFAGTARPDGSGLMLELDESAWDQEMDWVLS